MCGVAMTYQIDQYYRSNKLSGVVIMPKMKTNKGMKKRFKITKKGKVVFHSAGKSHLLNSKNRKRKRRLRADHVLGGKMAKNIKKLLS
jgi:large subunit ribosomal protein L35